MLSHAPSPLHYPVLATLLVAMLFTWLSLLSLFPILSSAQERAAGYRLSNASLMVLALTLTSGLVELPSVPAAKEKRRKPEGKGAEGNNCSLRKGVSELGLKDSSDEGHGHCLGISAAFSMDSGMARLLRLASSWSWACGSQNSA